MINSKTSLTIPFVRLREQLELEKDMRERGISRFRSRLTDHKPRGEESFTNYGKTLLANSIRPLAESIQKYTEEGKGEKGVQPIARRLLANLEPDITALITAKSIINSITISRKLTSSAINVASKIEDEISLRSFEEGRPEHYGIVKADLDKRSFGYQYKRRKLRESAQKNNLEWQLWTRSEKVHVGYKLIELMCLATGLCDVQQVFTNKRREKKLIPTKKTLEWINNRNDFLEVLAPEYFPTIVPPRRWEQGKAIGGGYYSRHIKPLSLVKYRKRENLNELEGVEMPIVYKSINAQQDTPYIINEFVFNVLKKAWDKNISVGGLPKAELEELPSKPHDIDTNKESRKLYRQKAVIVHTENARLKSKRLLFAKVLWIAEMFLDKPFYHAHTLDFRSRCYQVTNYLNGQGVDFAKALHLFGTGKKITEENKGDYWLAVTGAALYGLDKVTRKEQVEFIEENFNLFKGIAEDPFTNREWEKADKPFQFLAWCNEWVSFKAVGYGYISNFICNQDGSCNGIQHYSGILKHTPSAKAVNLANSEKPEDVYTVVKDKVIENLKTMTDNDLAKLWLQFGVKRSTVKRAIMTSPYGSTRYSCSDFVDEDITKRKDQGEQHPFGSLVFPACTFLAGVIWDSMGEVLSSARLGMSFLQQCARVLAKSGHPIRWINPVGFPVIQDYPEFKSMRVKTRLFGEVIKPRINVETEKFSVLKASNGLPPNFIHSQDSSHMMLVVSEAYDKGVSHFCNVHDSFGTLAADSQILADTIRTTFVKMYSNGCPLESFKTSIQPILTKKQIEKLPDVPQKGDFNIDEVMHSEFFFA